MSAYEWALRAIKDRIANCLGAVDDASSDIEAKENYRRLEAAARELHKCADEIQNILMRIKPK